LFFVECGSPLDAIESRSESSAVGGMARLIGHSVLPFSAYSKRAFTEACEYIGSICDDANDDTPEVPLCLHISSHGNPQGLAFGSDQIDWIELQRVIQPVLTRRYEGKRLLVISACNADQQQLSKSIAENAKHNGLQPPEYIFCATGKVDWDDAAVGCTLFYHLIDDVDLDDFTAVKDVLKKIQTLGMQIVYFRWDEHKYRSFPKKARRLGTGGSTSRVTAASAPGNHLAPSKPFVYCSSACGTRE
jgi:hypothetical protein